MNFFREIQLFQKSWHFRQGKKGVTILGNVTISDVTIMSRPSTLFVRTSCKSSAQNKIF